MQAPEGQGPEAAGRRRQAARAAHARLQAPGSDALSALAAYSAYCLAPDGDAFCRRGTPVFHQSAVCAQRMLSSAKHALRTPLLCSSR